MVSRMARTRNASILVCLMYSSATSSWIRCMSGMLENFEVRPRPLVISESSLRVVGFLRAIKPGVLPLDEGLGFSLERDREDTLFVSLEGGFLSRDAGFLISLVTGFLESLEMGFLESLETGFLSLEEDFSLLLLVELAFLGGIIFFSATLETIGEPARVNSLREKY